MDEDQPDEAHSQDFADPAVQAQHEKRLQSADLYVKKLALQRRTVDACQVLLRRDTQGNLHAYDISTYGLLLNLCARASHVAMAKRIFQLLRSPWPPLPPVNRIVCNIMIRMYCRAEDPKSAEALLNQMDTGELGEDVRPDDATFTTMMTYYSKRSLRDTTKWYERLLAREGGEKNLRDCFGVTAYLTSLFAAGAVDKACELWNVRVFITHSLDLRCGSSACISMQLPLANNNASPF